MNFKLSIVMSISDFIRIYCNELEHQIQEELAFFGDWKYDITIYNAARLVRVYHVRMNKQIDEFIDTSPKVIECMQSKLEASSTVNNVINLFSYHPKINKFLRTYRGKNKVEYDQDAMTLKKELLYQKSA